MKNLEDLITDLKKLNPTSITLTGSSALDQQVDTSDIEVAVIFRDSDYISLSELK